MRSAILLVPLFLLAACARQEAPDIDVAPDLHPCETIQRPVGQELATEFAARIRDQHVGPGEQVEIAIDRVLQRSGWFLVWAVPAGEEPGVFFFHDLQNGEGPRLVTIWRGPAPPSEREALVHWAHAVHDSMPDDLATCFAEAATSDAEASGRR